jgi:hypothetical protein
MEAVMLFLLCIVSMLQRPSISSDADNADTAVSFFIFFPASVFACYILYTRAPGWWRLAVGRVQTWKGKKRAASNEVSMTESIESPLPRSASFMLSSIRRVSSNVSLQSDVSSVWNPPNRTASVSSLAQVPSPSSNDTHDPLSPPAAP